MPKENGFDIHLTDSELENLADCITVDIVTKSIIDFNTNILKPFIHESIKEWFQAATEDHTAGMPEYENHRY